MNDENPAEPEYKFDKGKTRIGYMMAQFPHAMEEVARIATDGAAIHGDANWSKISIERWLDAHYRHMNKYLMGVTIDEDSGSNHLGHAAWSALAVLELYLDSLPREK